MIKIVDNAFDILCNLTIFIAPETYDHKMQEKMTLLFVLNELSPQKQSDKFYICVSFVLHSVLFCQTTNKST